MPCLQVHTLRGATSADTLTATLETIYAACINANSCAQAHTHLLDAGALLWLVEVSVLAPPDYPNSEVLRLYSSRTGLGGSAAKRATAGATPVDGASRPHARAGNGVYAVQHPDHDSSDGGGRGGSAGECDETRAADAAASVEPDRSSAAPQDAPTSPSCAGDRRRFAATPVRVAAALLLSTLGGFGAGSSEGQAGQASGSSGSHAHGAAAGESAAGSSAAHASGRVDPVALTRNVLSHLLPAALLDLLYPSDNFPSPFLQVMPCRAVCCVATYCAQDAVLQRATTRCAACNAAILTDPFS